MRGWIEGRSGVGAEVVSGFVVGECGPGRCCVLCVTVWLVVDQSERR